MSKCSFFSRKIRISRSIPRILLSASLKLHNRASLKRQFSTSLCQSGKERSSTKKENIRFGCFFYFCKLREIFGPFCTTFNSLPILFPALLLLTYIRVEITKRENKKKSFVERKVYSKYVSRGIRRDFRPVFTM